MGIESGIESILKIYPYTVFFTVDIDSPGVKSKLGVVRVFVTPIICMKEVEAEGASNVKKVIRFFGFLRLQTKSKTC
jgi:hypothetical protein